MTNVKHYIWLLGLSLVAIWQLFSLSSWSANVLSLINYLPYLIIVFGTFISIYMNRFLPILLMTFVAILNIASSYYMPATDAMSVSAAMLLAILPLLLPINLILWSWLPDKGINASLYNLFISLLFFLQLALIYFVMDSLPVQLIEKLNTGAQIEFINMPTLVVVALILGWLVIVFRNAYLDTISVIDRAIVFILILLTVAINQMHQPYVLAWLSSVSALLILIAIIFDSHKIAYTDQLTGVPSRRALLESFLALGRKYAVSMMDIDHFKKFNDTYGHDVGDKVLIIVANELSKISVGKVYRFGGEEFTIVFARKSAEEVEHALETVRKNIEAVKLDFIDTGKKKTKPKITVSFGLAEKSKQHKKPEEVLKSADEALYKAKKAGRNRTVIYNGKK
jgi:diguanylate cyclase (GGDEF)-like protein